MHFTNLKSVLLVCVITLIGFKSSIGQTNQQLLGQDADQDINTITTAVPFLLIAPDSRAGSMGDCGVATTPDANSMHWNPAKLAFVDDDMGFSVSYSPWLQALVNDINLAYLSFYRRIDKMQAFGASLRYFSMGEITFTDKAGESLGTFNPNEFSIDAAYSRKFSDNFSGAVSLRYIYSNLTGNFFVGGSESRPGQALATDVSAFYHKKLKVDNRNSILAFGINISNIGNKISYTETTQRDFIPINLRLGPSFTIELDKYNVLLFTADINKLLVPTPPIYARNDTTGHAIIGPDGNYVIANGMDPNRSVVSGMFQSFSDAPGGFSEEMKEFTWAFGVEYWYDKQFAIRGGYFHESQYKGNRKYFTLGAGLKYNVFGLDFAYLIPTEQRHPLENTLRFTLLFDFAAFTDQSKFSTPN
jgi:hypothetical protein